jgi:hypothetical protein
MVEFGVGNTDLPVLKSESPCITGMMDRRIWEDRNRQEEELQIR